MQTIGLEVPEKILGVGAGGAGKLMMQAHNVHTWPLAKVASAGTFRAAFANSGLEPEAGGHLRQARRPPPYIGAVKITSTVLKGRNATKV